MLPNAAHLTAVSRWASSQIIAGLFPPSSRVTFFRLLPAAAFITCLPTTVLPVKLIFPIPICALIAAPATDPRPVTTFSTPGGNPASAARRAMKRDVRGAISEGLKTIAFPVASAGPSFQESVKRGKFHGMIWPTTPILFSSGGSMQQETCAKHNGESVSVRSFLRQVDRRLTARYGCRSTSSHSSRLSSLISYPPNQHSTLKVQPIRQSQNPCKMHMRSSWAISYLITSAAPCTST